MHGAVVAPAAWTVTRWVEHYIDNVKGSKLAPNTARWYHGLLATWITPNIGSIPTPRHYGSNMSSRCSRRWCAVVEVLRPANGYVQHFMQH